MLLIDVLYWLAILLLSAAPICLFCFRRTKNLLAEQHTDTDLPKAKRPDYLIAYGMMAVYIVMASINLGSASAPNTEYYASEAGETVTFDLGEVRDVDSIYYFCGLTTRAHDGGTYKVFYGAEQDQFTEFSELLVKDDFFKWRKFELHRQARYIMLEAQDIDVTINELVVVCEGETVPVPIHASAQTGQRGVYLIDEQHTFPADYPASYLYNTYFDEIYHPRTAMEHLRLMKPYENTHPPLNKLIQSVSIAIFGANPLAWRLPGMLAGAFMIPALYFFGIMLFRKRIYGVIPAFLMMFDFMHFAQTRIATIDSFMCLFIILMFYFMYRHLSQREFLYGFGRSTTPLFLSGLMFALAASCKWIGFYGAIGLLFMFVYARLSERNEYNRYYSTSKNPVKRSEHRGFVVKTWLLAALFFIVIPALIYFACFIPYVLASGKENAWGDLIKYQIDMFNYHSRLVTDDPHAFASPWYSWPFDVRPIWFYIDRQLYDRDIISTISSFGNPAVWWVGAVSMVSAAVLSIIKRHRHMLVVFAAILALYLPNVLITREMFIYHYFTVVPFMILCITYMAKHLLEKKKKWATRTVYGYLAVVALLFVFFYPMISGLAVPKAFAWAYKWLPSWPFFY